MQLPAEVLVQRFSIKNAVSAAVLLQGTVNQSRIKRNLKKKKKRLGKTKKFFSLMRKSYNNRKKISTKEEAEEKF